MNISILAINSKYVHSSLALWYLTAACKDCGVVTPLEHSINEPRGKILQSVCESNPDVLAVCTYIWNIDMVLCLCKELKLVLPEVKIILGGPEASFRGKELMGSHPEIDGIVLGEGENALPSYLNGTIPNGFIYRHNNEIVQNGSYQCICDLNELPSPYTPEMLSSLKGKLAYFESSRGCPFSCSYCLSSATLGVRYFSVERVKDDILKLVSSGVETIKFVDRTFNANTAFATEIVSFLLTLDTKTTFHFEVGADLFKDELLNLLLSAPEGKFQIEAGIQSTNPETLKSVCRTTDTQYALSVLKKISARKNIHVHADLICGLPHEDLSSFKNSFNDLFAARPHTLQVGFLKLLHGSKLRDTFNGKFSPFAPYQVLESDKLSAQDLFFLQNFENAVELFYNSGRFSCTINYLASCLPSPFDLFALLSEKTGSHSAYSPDSLFELMASFCKSSDKVDISRAQAALSFDYLCSFKARFLPTFLAEPENSFHLIEQGKLPEFSSLPIKELLKSVAIKTFPYDMQCDNLPLSSCTYVISRRNRSPVDGRFVIKKL